MVAPVIAGCFFQFFYGYFSLMEMYCKRTDIIAYGSVAAAVVKIGLNFIFIPSFGYIGAAYTTMLGYGLLLVYHWVIFRHIFKAKIFAERQMLLLVVLAVILTLLLAHTYDMYLIRYLILTALLLFTGYIYRTNIKSLIRKFLKHEQF